MATPNTETTTLAAPTTGALAAFSPQNFWPRDWAEGLRYAELLARAPSLLPKHIQSAKDPAAEVFAHIMLGFEIGLAPLQALSAIFIVHGRRGIYAADQIALVQQHPDCEYFRLAADSKGNVLSSATSCTWASKKRGQPEQRFTFTMAQAELEGLVGQNIKYKTSPDLMLRWRCATRFIAFEWGAVTRGMEDREAVEVEEKDGGWAQRTTPPPAPPTARPVETAPFPPHDPKTGEVIEDAQTTPSGGAPVDELSAAYLRNHLETATTKEELQARSLLVQKAKTEGKLTPDEVKMLAETYKARGAVLNANGNGSSGK